MQNEELTMSIKNVHFRPATDHDWPHVVECWYGYAIGSAQSENIVEQLRAVTSPFTAWGAWQERQLLAAVIHSSQQIPFVHAWPLRSVVSSLDLAQDLWHAVMAQCRAEGKRFLQTLIPSHEVRDRAMMRSLGLIELTSIERYRLNDRGAMPTEGLPSKSVVLLQTDSPTTFNPLLAATFKGSLDVPELNALTQLDPVGNEYQSEHCQRLVIVTEHGIPLGVAVLEHVQDLASLRYLGLMPEERGQGYASAALKVLLTQSRCSQIEVRVDARNTPAIQLYQRAGFIKVDEEVLLYQPLHQQ